MKRLKNTDPLLLVITAIVLSFIIAILLLTATNTGAQDTAPAWEYGALIYEGESAFVFTDDLAVNSELNKVLADMGSEINLITAFNVMGAQGWDYSATLRAGESETLYLFQRPG
jgi:hypothetical protein